MLKIVTTGLSTIMNTRDASLIKQWETALANNTLPKDLLDSTTTQFKCGEIEDATIFHLADLITKAQPTTTMLPVITDCINQMKPSQARDLCVINCSLNPNNRWTANFPDAFASDSLQAWAKEGKPIILLANHVINSQLVNKDTLIESLFSQKNFTAFSDDQEINKEAVGSFIMNFATWNHRNNEEEARWKKSILESVLNRLKIHAQENNLETKDLIVNWGLFTSKYRGLTTIGALLCANQATIAKKLCADFGFNPNKQNTYEPYTGSLIEIIRSNEQVSEETFSAWLNTPGLNLTSDMLDISIGQLTQQLNLVFCKKSWILFKAIIAQNPPAENELNSLHEKLEPILPRLLRDKTWTETLTDDEFKFIANGSDIAMFWPNITLFNQEQREYIYQHTRKIDLSSSATYQARLFLELTTNYDEQSNNSIRAKAKQKYMEYRHWLSKPEIKQTLEKINERDDTKNSPLAAAFNLYWELIDRDIEYILTDDSITVDQLYDWINADLYHPRPTKELPKLDALSSLGCDKFIALYQRYPIASNVMFWKVIQFFSLEQIKTTHENLDQRDNTRLPPEMLQAKIYCKLFIEQEILTTTDQVQSSLAKIVSELIKHRTHKTELIPPVTEKITNKTPSFPTPTTVMALWAFNAFYCGKAPDFLTTLQKSSRSPEVLDNKSLLALNAAFYLFRQYNNSFLRDNFATAKYQGLIYILKSIGMYPANADVSKVKSRNDIKTSDAQECAWRVVSDKVDLRTQQLKWLLDNKVSVITAPRDKNKPTGAESEKIIKQLITTLAFRKLYLFSTEKGIISNFPHENLIDFTSRQTLYAGLKSFIIVQHHNSAENAKKPELKTALETCLKTIKPYQSELQSSVSFYTKDDDVSKLSKLAGLIDKQPEATLEEKNNNEATNTTPSSSAQAFERTNSNSSLYSL